jgi:hypothetical protein
MSFDSDYGHTTQFLFPTYMSSQFKYFAQNLAATYFSSTVTCAMIMPQHFATLGYISLLLNGKKSYLIVTGLMFKDAEEDMGWT